MAPPSLPASFVEIRDIDGEQVATGKLIDVMGLVKDLRLPIATAGAGELACDRIGNRASTYSTLSDYKCTLRLFDMSTEDSGEGIDAVIFRPKEEMPEFGLSDVVVLHKARVQRFKSNPVSLISHRTTKISVYKAEKIPKPPNSAKSALVPGHKRDTLSPNETVHQHVSYLFHEANKYEVPDESEFQQKAAASLNVKTTKFSLLQDVSDGRFYDVIARVARKPFDASDKVTLYISDYTENAHFFHYNWEGINDLTSRADPYGYTIPTQDDSGKEKDSWLGPFGKKALQITCYDPHASLIRSEVAAGDWVSIRNLQIKYGSNGQHLEGFLREERNFPGRINIDVLDTTNRETADPRLIEAVRRSRDYEKEKKQNLKQLQDAQTAGAKRKQSLGVDEGAQKPQKKKKSQQKRQLQRQKKQLEYQAQRQGQNEDPESTEKEGGNQELPDSLNGSITCESHPQAPTSSVAHILKPSYHESEDGRKLVLPFVCAKYQACVRVVDFHPASLEKFACSRKPREYEALLSDSEGSDDDGDTSDESMDEGGGARIWEWRFSLQLEDARRPGQRMWVVVDNPSGQCLTGLDASDLRTNRRTLELLRERMFLLWGNLEEKKLEASRAQKSLKPQAAKKLQLEKPQLDSSDREDNGASPNGWESQVSNQPFVCCIQQYGVSVTGAASASDEEWTRVFALFGTKISY